jgi:hypothetical protein
VNREAAFQTALCTTAMAAVSAGTLFFVDATRGGPLTLARAGAALVLVAIGTWFIYIGHCRNMPASTAPAPPVHEGTPPSEP